MSIDVSVIIPTYNRRDSLLRTLDSLVRQTYPTEYFEVIVVDDGSCDATESVVEKHYPFTIHYLSKENQGATEARNYGADHSSGGYLVFVDDDITLEETALQAIVSELRSHPKTVVLGTLYLPLQLAERSAFGRARYHFLKQQDTQGDIPFYQCMTGLLAIAKSDFYCLEKFQDPTGGWPNWDDIDFGYRAVQAGFGLWRSALVVAEHWDHASIDLAIACQRWYRASRSAPRLFLRHPAMRTSISMFLDKDPVEWHLDSPELILRKLRRQVISSRSLMWLMEKSVQPIERNAPESPLLRILYRQISGGYIYRGYRQGLRSLS